MPTLGQADPRPAEGHPLLLLHQGVRLVVKLRAFFKFHAFSFIGFREIIEFFK
jgi:hypothetical protein